MTKPKNVQINTYSVQWLTFNFQNSYAQLFNNTISNPTKNEKVAIW